MEPKEPADWRAPDDPYSDPNPYPYPGPYPGPNLGPNLGPNIGPDPVWDDGRRRFPRVWWLVGGVIVGVVLALAVWAVAPGGGVQFKLDPALQDSLLTEADYPEGYSITELTQSDLDNADEPTQIDPDDVTPSDCGQMLNTTPPDLDATLPAAMATAQASGSPVYVNGVVSLPEDVQDDDWNLDAYDTLLDECSSFSVEAEGQSMDLSVSGLDVDDLGDRSVAFLIEGSPGGTSISFGMGIVQTDDRMIMLMGVGQEELDETEFSDLLTTAVDRAA